MHKKSNLQLFLGSFIFIIAALFGLTFINPNITGHVLVNINRQNLNIMINESQNFLLTADNEEHFTITSFKISGNITGNGRVKIYIDNGRGQRLLVYKNIAKNSAEQKSLPKITGAVTEKIKKENANDEWLVIKPINTLLEKEIFDEVGSDESLVNGQFAEQCMDTCFMKMQISRNIAYRFIFLVEHGNTLKINEIVYRTED